MGRAPCCDKANVKRGPWSPEEDAKLKSYIEDHGTGGNWIALPQKIGTSILIFINHQYKSNIYFHFFLNYCSNIYLVLNFPVSFQNPNISLCWSVDFFLLCAWYRSEKVRQKLSSQMAELSSPKHQTWGFLRRRRQHNLQPLC